MSNDLQVLSAARHYLALFKVANPELASDAQDFYNLMVDEINAGESPDNEAELFYNSLSELLNPTEDE
jgi:hypothetical protein